MDNIEELTRVWKSKRVEFSYDRLKLEYAIRCDECDIYRKELSGKKSIIDSLKYRVNLSVSQRRGGSTVGKLERTLELVNEENRGLVQRCAELSAERDSLLKKVDALPAKHVVDNTHKEVDDDTAMWKHLFEELRVDKLRQDEAMAELQNTLKQLLGGRTTQPHMSAADRQKALEYYSTRHSSSEGVTQSPGHVDTPVTLGRLKAQPSPATVKGPPRRPVVKRRKRPPPSDDERADETYEPPSSKQAKKKRKKQLKKGVVVSSSTKRATDAAGSAADEAERDDSLGLNYDSMPKTLDFAPREKQEEEEEEEEEEEDDEPEPATHDVRVVNEEGEEDGGGGGTETKQQGVHTSEAWIEVWRMNKKERSDILMSYGISRKTANKMKKYTQCSRIVKLWSAGESTLPSIDEKMDFSGSNDVLNAVQELSMPCRFHKGVCQCCSEHRNRELKCPLSCPNRGGGGGVVKKSAKNVVKVDGEEAVAPPKCRVHTRPCKCCEECRRAGRRCSRKCRMKNNLENANGGGVEMSVGVNENAREKNDDYFGANDKEEDGEVGVDEPIDVEPNEEDFDSDEDEAYGVVNFLKSQSPSSPPQKRQKYVVTKPVSKTTNQLFLNFVKGHNDRSARSKFRIPKLMRR